MWMRIAVVLCWLPIGTGCAALSPREIAPKPPTFAAVPATVFVADGAGNFQSASQFLRKVVQADGYPIDVVTFDWSHGNARIVRDQVDLPHARCEGKKLAALVQTFHADHPDHPVYLLAHSAGATVALAALEILPPTVIERAVIMAPSVSRFYDVQPALGGVKKDIHVFYSPRDHFVLGTLTRLVGTADRRCTATAGRFGFTPQRGLNATEHPNLIHHRWRPGDRVLGNNGGHFGSYQPDHLREKVIPLLNPGIR